MRLILCFFLLFAISGCTADSVTIECIPANKGVKNTIERARVLSQIKWTPLNDLERNNHGIYHTGVPVNGVPYSSVKELQTYIGHDVSLYTFITSTMNPYSLLYTEAIDEPPYHGTNCKLYYGVVCSSAVMYALGIRVPYSTLLFDDTDYFVRCNKQSPSDIFLCSVLFEPGHMLMVVGIDKDHKNNIVSVDLFESSQSGTRVFTVPYNQFCERWAHNQIVQYEYKHIANNIERVNFISDIDILHQDFTKSLELCPNKGDKSSYAINENVVVNILTINQYETIELYNESTLVNSLNLSSLSDNKVEYSNLFPGEYQIRLSDADDEYSSWAYFEVLDNSTVINDFGDKIHIAFNSLNAVPEFISFNSKINGAAKSIFEITKGEDEFWIPVDTRDNKCLRVVYKGRYGRIYFQYELE